MNDLEDKVRAALGRDSSRAPSGRTIPTNLRRRVRRRQVFTASTAAGVTVSVVIAAVIGVAHLSGGTGQAPAGHIPSIPPASPDPQLQWSRSGSSVVASGNDLGVDWSLRADPNGDISISAGGKSSIVTGVAVFSLFSVPGGSFYYGSTTGAPVRVDVVRSDGTVYHGRWMPEARGKPGRVWLVVLPQRGHGFAVEGNSTPSASSWPSGTMSPGSVFDAGTVPSGGSWWLGFPDPSEGSYCLSLQTIEGTVGPCLTPGTDPQVLASSVGTGDITVVSITVPSNVKSFYLRAPSRELLSGGSCDAPPSPAPGAWSGRAICTFSVPTRSGSAILRLYGGSGFGQPKNRAQVLPSRVMTWSQGVASLSRS